MMEHYAKNALYLILLMQQDSALFNHVEQLILLVNALNAMKEEE